jgi:hypothetical protein
MKEPFARRREPYMWWVGATPHPPHIRIPLRNQGFFITLLSPYCRSHVYQITITMVPDGVLASGECGLCGARAQCLQPSVRDRQGA